jgi:ATP synthase F0 subunit b
MRRWLFCFAFLLALCTPLVKAQNGQAAPAPTAVARETAHPAEAHEEAEAPKTYFGIPGWILKLLNMLTFLGVLGYFLGGPIRKAFDERREKIRVDLVEAKVRRQKADSLADDIDARLAQLERDVASILERAAEDGEKQKKEMIAAGEVEAAKVLVAARSEIDARVKAARSDLAAMAAQMTTDQALALAASSLTDADRKRIFGESLDQVEEIPT